MRLDGKTSHYIDAALDLAVDTMSGMKSTDRQRRSMGQRMDSGSPYIGTPGKSMAEVARDKMNERLMNGGDE
jgi:hypothetical protein